MDGITIPRDHPVYGVIQKMYKMEGMESEATQKAESNAEMTAKSIDKKLCGVKRIFVNCVQNRGPAPAAYGAAFAKSTPVEAQKVKMEVYVNADFYVK